MWWHNRTVKDERQLIFTAGGRRKYLRSFCAQRRSEWVTFEKGKVRVQLFNYIIDNEDDWVIKSVIKKSVHYEKWLRHLISSYLIERLSSRYHIPSFHTCVGIILRRADDLLRFETFQIARAYREKQKEKRRNEHIRLRREREREEAEAEADRVVNGDEELRGEGAAVSGRAASVSSGRSTVILEEGEN